MVDSELDLTLSLEAIEPQRESIYGAVDRRFTSAVYNQVKFGHDKCSELALSNTRQY